MKNKIWVWTISSLEIGLNFFLSTLEKLKAFDNDNFEKYYRILDLFEIWWVIWYWWFDLFSKLTAFVWPLLKWLWIWWWFFLLCLEQYSKGKDFH